MRPGALLVLLLALATHAFAQPCTDSFAEVYGKVSPTVVSIQATKINKAKPQRRFETLVGSGVVIERDGQILTNAHVVDGAASLSVTLDSGTKAAAKVIGLDSLLDLALIRIETPSSLATARLGDSSTLRVGDEVAAIGNPIGLEQTMTRGIVSGLNRLLPGLAEQPMIQTDAPINPGNSGGPLGDGNGRVVGMNTAGSTNANGIGFAIPSAVLQRVAQSLVQGKTPGHPYVGICFQPIEEALATTPDLKGYGVVVQRALPGTPAEKAGIQTNDVIEKIDGADLNNGQTLGGVLQLHNPGDTVKMTTLRNGSTTDLTVTLGDRPANGGPGCSSP